MKKGYVRLIAFEIVMILFLLFDGFVLNIIDNNIKRIFFWLISFCILKFISGFEKDKSVYKTDLLMEVFVFAFIYIILEYVLGIFLGFVRSPYSLEIITIIKNICPLIILIILEELTRYIFITKGKNNACIYILSCIIFIVFDTFIIYGLYDANSKKGIFDIIVLGLLPSISSNILLTYLTAKGGYKPSILYRVILELFIYVVPIYADLGDYIESIMKVVFPLIFLFRIAILFKKHENDDIRSNSKKYHVIVMSFLVTILIILVYLVSGVFKYYLLAIATGSMAPNINIGDVVVVEKIDSDKLDTLNVGDILVFKYDSRVIVHRIAEIREMNNSYVFKTKGDANNDIDNWLVYDSQVIGVAKIRLKYIGYPTVLLNNYLNK